MPDGKRANEHSLSLAPYESKILVFARQAQFRQSFTRSGRAKPLSMSAPIGA